MRSILWPLLTLAALGLVACGELATQELDAGDVIVVTVGEGAPAAAGQSPVLAPLSSFGASTANLGGSTSEPVYLTAGTCTAGSAKTISVTFSVTGTQSGDYRFDLYTSWSYDGTSWIGSNIQAVDVPQQGNTTNFFPINITLENDSDREYGTSQVTISTFNVRRISGGGGNPLDGTGTATVHVAFNECEVEPDPPTLTLPDKVVAEATSSNGAHVDFSSGTSAVDFEGTILTVSCAPLSGSLFAHELATEVKCSATDSGGRTTDGSFFVHVQDTTPPVFTSFPEDITLIAPNINGVTLDLSEFAITASDKGPNNEDGDVTAPVTVECKIGEHDAQGYSIGIGGTATITCTARDSAHYRAPGYEAVDSPNVKIESFEVTVGLDLSSTCGFLPPLRNEDEGPFSAHKTNSTIPHKICPPAYADGSLATDLAPVLGLVLVREGATPPGVEVVDEVFGAGSTVWRYVAADEHYIFNLKTDRGWKEGTYSTTVTAFDIELAKTKLVLRR